MKRILCPVDFSDFTQTTNQYASLLAKADKANLIYFHVFMSDLPYDSYAYVDVKQDEARQRRRLEKIAPSVPGVVASHIVEFGSPAEEILKYAHENKIDLIVMGTHGRTGLMRLVMGSVAEEVLRKAECPVITIRTNISVPQTS